MEPPAATARITGSKCEVWGCFQSPQATKDLVAKRLGISPDDVTVNVTLLGGGFGRKSKPDFGIEAAVLSKAVDGKPVKVTWTRDDDLHNSYYHTVSVEHLEAGVDAQGKPVAWLHRTAAPTIFSTFNPEAKNEAPLELAMGVINVPFAIPNIRIENPEAVAHTRIGWFRSVSNIPHAFAVQSFVAEMAAAAGRDPKDFLLEVIGPTRLVSPEMLGDTWNHGESPERYPVDTGRLKRVIETGGARVGLGPEAAEGQRPRHRRALQLRELRGGRGGSLGRQQGCGHDPAHRHRGRLRRHGQSRPGAGPDGGRGDHGHRRDAR